jgi:hypothetical protein
LLSGWRGKTKDNIVTGDDAQSGKNYVIAWNRNHVHQAIKVKKGQEVTVTFYAKSSDGPAEKTK